MNYENIALFLKAHAGGESTWLGLRKISGDVMIFHNDQDSMGFWIYVVMI